MTKATQESRMIAGRCWCDPRVGDTEMDSVLAEVFAEVIEGYLEDSRLLHALEEAGVNNWEGHGYAMELLQD